jgi:hypothetical protein
MFFEKKDLHDLICWKKTPDELLRKYYAFYLENLGETLSNKKSSVKPILDKDYYHFTESFVSYLHSKHFRDEGFFDYEIVPWQTSVDSSTPRSLFYCLQFLLKNVENDMRNESLLSDYLSDLSDTSKSQNNKKIIYVTFRMHIKFKEPINECVMRENYEVSMDSLSFTGWLTPCTLKCLLESINDSENPESTTSNELEQFRNRAMILLDRTITGDNRVATIINDNPYHIVEVVKLNVVFRESSAQ